MSNLTLVMTLRVRYDKVNKKTRQKVYYIYISDMGLRHTYMRGIFLLRYNFYHSPTYTFHSGTWRINNKRWIFVKTKDYCITGRANVISVQLAFAKFLSKIKGNLRVSAVSMILALH